MEKSETARLVRITVASFLVAAARSSLSVCELLAEQRRPGNAWAIELTWAAKNCPCREAQRDIARLLLRMNEQRDHPAQLVVHSWGKSAGGPTWAKYMMMHLRNLKEMER